jgi:hypothetical protein
MNGLHLVSRVKCRGDNRRMLMIFGTFQAATIAFAFFISTLKPWRKRGSKAERKKPIA